MQETILDFAISTTKIILDDLALQGHLRKEIGRVIYERLLASLQCFVIAARSEITPN